jgi:hypothetical protein
MLGSGLEIHAWEPGPASYGISGESRSFDATFEPNGDRRLVGDRFSMKDSGVEGSVFTDNFKYGKDNELTERPCAF